MASWNEYVQLLQEASKTPGYQKWSQAQRDMFRALTLNKVVLQDPDVQAEFGTDPSAIARAHKQWFAGAVPEPDVLSDERYGKAVDYAQMLDPRSMVAGAKQFAGAVPGIITGEGTEQFPRVARTHEALQGAMGVVTPPLVAAGLAASTIPTIATLGAFTAAGHGMEKGKEALEKQGVEVNPELYGLGSEVLLLTGGAKLGHKLTQKLPSKRLQSLKQDWANHFRQKGMSPEQAQQAADLAAARGATPPTETTATAAPAPGTVTPSPTAPAQPTAPTAMPTAAALPSAAGLKRIPPPASPAAPSKPVPPKPPVVPAAPAAPTVPTTNVKMAERELQTLRELGWTPERAKAEGFTTRDQIREGIIRAGKKYIAPSPETTPVSAAEIAATQAKLTATKRGLANLNSTIEAQKAEIARVERTRVGQPIFTTPGASERRAAGSPVSDLPSREPTKGPARVSAVPTVPSPTGKRPVVFQEHAAKARKALGLSLEDWTKMFDTQLKGGGFVTRESLVGEQKPAIPKPAAKKSGPLGAQVGPSALPASQPKAEPIEFIDDSPQPPAGAHLGMSFVPKERPSAVPGKQRGPYAKSEAQKILASEGNQGKPADTQRADYTEALLRLAGKWTSEKKGGTTRVPIREAQAAIRAGEIPPEVANSRWYQELAQENPIKTRQEIRAETRKRTKGNVSGKTTGQEASLNKVVGNEGATLEDFVPGAETGVADVRAIENARARLASITPEQRAKLPRELQEELADFVPGAEDIAALNALDEAAATQPVPKPVSAPTPKPTAVITPEMQKRVKDLGDLDVLLSRSSDSPKAYAKNWDSLTAAVNRAGYKIAPEKLMDLYDQARERGTGDARKDVTAVMDQLRKSAESQRGSIGEGYSKRVQDQWLSRLPKKPEVKLGNVKAYKPFQGEMSPEAAVFLPDGETAIATGNIGHHGVAELIQTGKVTLSGPNATKRGIEFMDKLLDLGALRKTAVNSYEIWRTDGPAYRAMWDDLRLNKNLLEGVKSVFVDGKDSFRVYDTAELIANNFDPSTRPIKTGQLRDSGVALNTSLFGLDILTSKALKAGRLGYKLASNFYHNRRDQVYNWDSLTPYMNSIRDRQTLRTGTPSTIERIMKLPHRIDVLFHDQFRDVPGHLGYRKGDTFSAGSIAKRTGIDAPLEDLPYKRIKTIYGGGGGQFVNKRAQVLDIYKPLVEKGIDDSFIRYLNYRANQREARILELKARELETANNLAESKIIRDRINSGKALPGGKSLTENNVEFDTFKRNLKPEHLAEIEQSAERFYKEGQRFLDDMYDAGMMTREELARYNDYGHDYASMRRLFNNDEMIRNEFGGAAMDLKTMNLFKAMEGSELVNVNPLEATLATWKRGYNFSARNRMMRELQDFRNTDPLWAETMVEYTGGDVPKGMTRIGLFENGKPKRYLVPKELGNILTNADPVFGKLVAGMHKTALDRFLAASKGVLQRTAIGQSVRFTARNIPKDFRATRAYADRRVLPPGSKPITTAELAKEWMKVFKEGLDSNSAEMQEYLKSDAGFATLTHSIGRDKMLDIEMPPLEAIKRGRVFDSMLGFTALTEQAPKRAMFNLLRQRGVSASRAASISREYAGSPDAANGGLLKDYMNVIIPFSNMRIQGLSRIVEFSRTHPKRAAELMAAGAGVVSMIGAWNAKQLDPETGERIIDKIDKRELRDNWVILLPFAPTISPTGQKFYYRNTFAKTYEEQYFLNPLQKVHDRFLDGKEFKQQDALDMVSLLSPLNVDLREGKIAASIARGAQASVNPGIGVLADQALNYNAALDRPIVNQELARIERQRQVSSATSRVAEEISKGDYLRGAAYGATLGFSAGGGLEGSIVGAAAGVTAALYGASPARLDAAVERTLGGSGQTITRAFDMTYPERQNALPLTNLEKLRASPIIGDLLSTIMGGPVSGIELEANERFYDVAKQADIIAATASYLEKHGKWEEYEEYLKNPANTKYLTAWQITNRMRGTISQLLNIAELLPQHPAYSDEEKRRKLFELAQAREQLLIKTNDEVKRILESETNAPSAIPAPNLAR